MRIFFGTKEDKFFLECCLALRYAVTFVLFWLFFSSYGYLSKNVFHHRFPQFFIIIIIIKELKEMKFNFCRVFLLCYTFCVFFYTRSGLSPQHCLYFQSFWGSKLLNGCLVVLPSNQYLQGII